MAEGFSWNEAEFEQLANDPHGPVGQELERRVIIGESAAKRLLSQPGTGRTYQKYRPRRLHRASAPGAPPAVDTGLLRARVGHETGIDDAGLYGTWGTDYPVGLYLELGTRHIEPRPWLRPSLDIALEE